jgi:hypothetical protein
MSAQNLNSSKTPVVIILFLAHYGVTQSLFWDKWKNYCSEPDRIVFKVHAPENPKYGNEFCKKNSIGFYNPDTAWCDANLIFAFLQCLHVITREYTNSEGIIYLVSGYDIPIVPADAVLGKIIFSRENKLSENPFMTKICTSGEFDSQWMALNIVDASALVKLMINDGIYYELKQKWLEGIRKTKDNENCPDNYFISSAIKLNKEMWINEGGLSETWENVMTKPLETCITADIRHNNPEPSPIEWYNYNQEQVYINGACYYGNIEFSILYYRTYESNINSFFFFRKVAQAFDALGSTKITAPYEDEDDKYDRERRSTGARSLSSSGLEYLIDPNASKHFKIDGVDTHEDMDSYDYISAIFKAKYLKDKKFYNDKESYVYRIKCRDIWEIDRRDIFMKKITPLIKSFKSDNDIVLMLDNEKVKDRKFFM